MTRRLRLPVEAGGLSVLVAANNSLHTRSTRRLFAGRTELEAFVRDSVAVVVEAVAALRSGHAAVGRAPAGVFGEGGAARAHAVAAPPTVLRAARPSLTLLVVADAVAAALPAVLWA